MSGQEPGDGILLSALGVPIPVSYRVEQVEGVSDGVSSMKTKLYLASPVGVLVFFFDGEQAEELGNFLTKAGRSCKAGIYVPGTSGFVGEDRSARRRTGAPASRLV